jgi:dephospho-CoA kinase
MIAVDAVKLIESKLSDLCDSVWVVVCDPDLQLQRLMARNGFTREDAVVRISAQPPVEPKLAVADEIIDNSGTETETRTQVHAAWQRVIAAGARVSV